MLTLISLFFFTLPAHADSPPEYIKDNAIAITDLANWPKETFPLAAKPKVIFIGEMHGSVEPPLAVTGLAKVLKARSEKVAVALEIWQDQQTLIDGYMKTGDKRLLEASPFFTSQYQDGRRSQAMVALLESLRGQDIPVICFDPESGTGPMLDNQLRNTGMAMNLAIAAVKYPDRKLLVLTGNYHSMVTEATMATGEKISPAAYLLSRLEGTPLTSEDILALRVRQAGGSGWMCTPECGVHYFPEEVSSYSQAVDYSAYVLLDDAIYDGHQGTLFVRTLTASPPFIKGAGPNSRESGRPR